MARWIAAVALLCVALTARATSADDRTEAPPPPVRVERAAAQAAIQRFEATVDDDGAAAVRLLAAHAHQSIARRLLDVALGKRADVVRTEAFIALAEQEDKPRRAAGRLRRWLLAEAEVSRTARLRGDCGLPVHQRTGRLITKGPEAEAALAECRRRGRLLAAALRLAVRYEMTPGRDGFELREFLLDPTDDAVLATLDLLVTWDDKEALPDLLRLFRMYPEPHRWDTGGCTSNRKGGAGAQNAWRGIWGHPLRMTARPRVHHAVRGALAALTGCELASPDALATYLESPRR
jgi:hypothetical protein